MEPCAACRKPLTSTYFATRDGFICTRCEGKQRKAFKKATREQRRTAKSRQKETAA